MSFNADAFLATYKSRGVAIASCADLNVVRGLLSERTLTSAKDFVEQVENHPDEHVYQQRNRHLDCPCVMDICLDENVMAAASCVLGPTQLIRTMIMQKTAVRLHLWHRDDYYAGTAGNLDKIGNIQVAITPATEENCMEVIPGSHLWSDEEYEAIRDTKANHPDSELVILEPGQFAMFHASLVHRTHGIDTFDGERIGLALRFIGAEDEAGSELFTRCPPLAHKSLVYASALANPPVPGNLREPVDQEERAIVRRGEGKTVVVSGASGQIGSALIVGFAREGYDLAICSRTDLSDVAMYLQREYRVRVVAGKFDICDWDRCKEFAEAVRQIYGSVDVLINNAGASFSGPLLTSDPDEWKACIATNLFSTYHLTRVMLPMMVAPHPGGAIINMGSGSGHIVMGENRNSAYVVAKAAVDKFSSHLALELKDANVSVNEVLPGPTQRSVPSDEILMSSVGAFDEVVKDPDSVCELILWLAAQDPNRGPTGQTFALHRRALR